MNGSISNKISNMSIVCAFLVVLIHCRPQFEFGTFSWWMRQILEEGICTIAVPFFFLVSGLMLSRHIHEKGWYFQENKKRLFSIVAPYFIWATLFVAYRLLLREGGDIYLYSRYYAFSYFQLPLLSSLWFLRALFILFLLSPLLVYFTRLKYLGLIGLFIVYGIISPGPSGEGWVHALTRNGILPAAGIFYFTTGLVIGQYPIKIKFNQGLALSSLCIGLFLSFVQASFYYWGINQWAQYWGWLAIPFMMAGVWGLVSDKQWPKWLVSASFPIYLIHKFLFPNRLANLEYVLKSGFLGCLMIAALVFVLSLCATIIFRKVLPKIAQFCFGGR